MKNKIKVVSFNIRSDAARDGLNDFHHRKAYILDKLATERPGIIGFQEITSTMLDWLGRYLPEYSFVGCGRSATYDNEYNSIAYRRDILELHGLDVFWLSPTPTVPGTVYEEQSDCPRICVATLLKHKQSSQPFRFYNTHLDHIGQIAQTKGLTQILNRISQDQAIRRFPVILTGDFNFTPSQPQIHVIKQYPELALRDLAAAIPTTFHDYGRRNDAFKIDYIYVDAETAETAEPAVAWDECHEGVYLTDHYPICAQVMI